MSKRIITDYFSSVIDNTEGFQNNFTVWGNDVWNNHGLYAVIIANDNKFEGL